MKRFFTYLYFAFLYFAVATPLQASTMRLDVVLNFDVVKVQHDCVGEGFYSLPNPGPGGCGRFQVLDFGQTYVGSIKFSGEFLALGDVFELLSGSAFCSFGPLGCDINGSYGPAAPGNRFSEEAISWTPIISNYNSDFGFDLVAGTGWHEWEDDGEPFFSKGRFAFSNVSVTGLPTAVPLSASLPFLLAGLGVLGVAGRRRRR